MPIEIVLTQGKLMIDNYPTEDELAKITIWPLKKTTDFIELIEYIRTLWWMPEWGYKLVKNNLTLHTGGWSGNEEIIAALEKNWIFWSACWQKSTRGGHFWFKLPRRF